ncbi:MAG: F-box protein [Chlamydiota bacterium]
MINLNSSFNTSINESFLCNQNKKREPSNKEEKTINISKKIIFDKLSDDLIIHIFSFLTFRNIYKCKLISSKYKKIISNSLIITNNLIIAKDKNYLELFGVRLSGVDLSQINPKVRNLYIDSFEGVSPKDIPETVCFLSLHGCDLKHKLTDIPISINELHLCEYKLKDVNLQDIPESVCLLSFRSCDLKGVNLQDIPKSVSSLSINDCDVGNKLRHLPPSVFDLELTSLEGINLRDIPETVCFLSLHGCDLKKKLTDIPVSINELHLCGCKLEGVNLRDIPEGVCFLSFRSCNLKGVNLKDIPKSVSSLSMNDCDVG